jgi:hypothetical protein
VFYVLMQYGLVWDWNHGLSPGSPRRTCSGQSVTGTGYPLRTYF